MPVAAIAAGVGAIGSIAGAAISSHAQGKAADEQAAAAQQAAQYQMGVYDDTKTAMAPYSTTGASALTQLSSLFGLGAGGTGGISSAATSTLENTPGYQFMLSQGQQSLDRSAASKGMVLSGAQLKDSQTFGQNTALVNAWTPYVSQLNSMAAAGQNSVYQTGQIGTQAAANAGNSLEAAGNAQATGTLGAAQSWNNGINGVVSSLGGTSGISSILGGNTSSYGASSASGGYAAAASLPTYGVSDERAKTDIKHVGETHEGLKVYTYRYRGDRESRMGVMAQDVARVKPRAVGRRSDGVLGVDYAQIGSPFAGIVDQRKAA